MAAKLILCVGCDRGYYGTDKDKCSCGWNIKKKSDKRGCFCGTKIKGVL